MQDNKSRFSSENDPVFEAVENDALQCRDCVYMIPGNTIECDKYYEKPGYVIYGSKPCPKYVPKEGVEKMSARPWHSGIGPMAPFKP